MRSDTSSILRLEYKPARRRQGVGCTSDMQRLLAVEGRVVAYNCRKTIGISEGVKGVVIEIIHMEELRALQLPTEVECRCS
jgi:hypothetical protein